MNNNPLKSTEGLTQPPQFTVASTCSVWVLVLILAAFTRPVAAQNFNALDAQLYKAKLFVQATNGAPTAAPGTPYLFQAIIGPSAPTYVSAATVTTPASVVHTMTLDATMNFEFTNGVASQSALDTAYGTGSYTIKYTGITDGQVSVPVSLGSDNFPPAPSVSNVLSAQSLNATNDFLVTFAPDSTGTDFAQLTVVDGNGSVVFRTEPIYYGLGLSATNTSIDIPADTLSPGTSYTGLLQFLRITTLSQVSLPYVQAGFMTQTAFNIQTQGAASIGNIDALAVQLYKGTLYKQGTNGAPNLASNLPYEFTSILVPVLASQVSGVFLLTPTLASNTMPLNTTTNFIFTNAFSSQSALDSSYGTGSYYIYYNGLDDGSVAIPVALGADAFPPAPVVSNITAAQSIIASNNFVVSFAPETNAAEYVQLSVLNSNGIPVFQTQPIYFSAGLSATNSAINLPANTLAPGTNYTGQLQFLRLSTVSVGTTPFVQAGCFAQTTFPIQTQSTNSGGGTTNTPPPPPTAPASFLASYLTLTITNGGGSFASNGVYEFFTSPVGGNYVILGPQAHGLTSGTYVYAANLSNSAVLALVDSKLGGGLNFQIQFTGTGSGVYSISGGPTNFQSGLFGTASNYTSITPANLYLPSLSNTVFNSFFSGHPGASYTLQSSSNLIN